jgi:phosphoribosylformylglycinamidine synthase
VKALVIVFPGSNCDRDVAVALEHSLGRAPILHWHADPHLPEVDLVVLPGGFSYGDYLRSGAMAARAPAVREVVARAGRGLPVRGICNGFQILTEAGLLPGALMRNASLKFICKDVFLRVEADGSVFTAGLPKGAVVRMPIAHHDGNYFADEATLAEIEAEGRVAFRYCTASGEVTEQANPNGSRSAIAGILNRERNVLGMMPHPERLADPLLSGEDGKRMFNGLIAALT